MWKNRAEPQMTIKHGMCILHTG